jgi:predicted cobalt transporter CbtA
MTDRDSWGRRLATGAIAGTVGGLASAVVLILVTEPRISQAIAIEEQLGAGDQGQAHSHGAGVTVHDHGELVTRLQQQIGGVITVVVVAALFGMAFAAVYANNRHRLSGGSDAARSMMLAGLGFVAFALAPALAIPANPPAVGDDDTVNQRAVDYLAVIALTVLLILAVATVDKAMVARRSRGATRWITGFAVVVGGIIVLFLLMPRVTTEIPEQVPAALVWEFRLASLAQLAAMWAVMGLAHGALTERRLNDGSAGKAGLARTTAL